mmetsp:Transcript_66796/g.188751  ORF Transcript_66796/g.188751 Transcript_66796/m.188751 type:complete len:235 (-) Transcript_66796:229-933(-)
MQKRIPLEHDVEVIDALVDCIPNSLGEQHRQHEGHDIVEATRELQHDDDQGNCHSAHSSQHRCSADHGIHPGIDLVAEESPVLIQGLERAASAPAQAGADEERGHEEAGGAGRADGEGHLAEANDGRREEHHEQIGVSLRVVAVVSAQAHLGLEPVATGLGLVVGARVKHGVDGICGQRTCEREGPRGDQRQEGDHRHLRHRVDPLLVGRLRAEGVPPDVDRVEERPDKTTRDA